jgi:hypothetical protein
VGRAPLRERSRGLDLARVRSAKVNNVNPNGGGITGRIFTDGIEVLTRFIANTDGISAQDSVVRQVASGSLIDFVIDPLGIAPGTGDGAAAARADGAHFLPSSAWHPAPNPGHLPRYSAQA